MKFATCKRNSNDTPVIQGLSVSPSEIMDLSTKGQNISELIANAGFNEGTSNCSFEIPIYDDPRADPADIFEAQCDAKDKIRDAYKKEKLSKIQELDQK